MNWLGPKAAAAHTAARNDITTKLVVAREPNTTPSSIVFVFVFHNNARCKNTKIGIELGLMRAHSLANFGSDFAFIQDHMQQRFYMLWTPA